MLFFAWIQPFVPQHKLSAKTTNQNNLCTLCLYTYTEPKAINLTKIIITGPIIIWIIPKYLKQHQSIFYALYKLFLKF